MNNSKLIVIGDKLTDPEYIDKLKQIADTRVIFIPFITDKSTLFGVMSGARIFIFPSTVEAMSMALLEAATLGIPIICSDIPANLAILAKFAVYFHSGNSANLEDKLNWAINHPDKMKNLGLKAQTWVKKNFSWDIIAEQYNKLYKSI